MTHTSINHFERQTELIAAFLSVFMRDIEEEGEKVTYLL